MDNFSKFVRKAYMTKTKNVMVQVARMNLETRQFEEKVIHVDECVLKDKHTARCPECQERVTLMLEGDRHSILWFGYPAQEGKDSGRLAYCEVYK